MHPQQQQGRSRTGIIAVVVIVLIVIVYFYFSGGSAPASSTLIEGGGQGIGTNELNTLNQVRSLHIDTNLFKDPAYLSLVDYTVAITPDNVGRANPFAPIPGMPVSTSTRR